MSYSLPVVHLSPYRPIFIYLFALLAVGLIFCPVKLIYCFLILPKALQLNWHLPMYKVLGGLGGKGLELRGQQHVVIISPKKKNIASSYKLNSERLPEQQTAPSIYFFSFSLFYFNIYYPIFWVLKLICNLFYIVIFFHNDDQFLVYVANVLYLFLMYLTIYYKIFERIFSTSWSFHS